MKIVESLKELDAGRLAAAGRADERDLLSGREREVEWLQHIHLLAGRVAKFGVLEPDVALHAILQLALLYECYVIGKN